jgi:hypothetical protein
MKIRLILTFICLVLGLEAWSAAPTPTNTLITTNIPITTNLNGSFFLVHVPVSGNALGLRQASSNVVAAAFGGGTPLSTITNIVVGITQPMSNSLRTITFQVGLANTNYTTAVSNSLYNLAYALAASGTNNVTSLSNAIIAYVNANTSITNAVGGAGQYELLIGNKLRRLEFTGDATVTTNGDLISVDVTAGAGASNAINGAQATNIFVGLAIASNWLDVATFNSTIATYTPLTLATNLRTLVILTNSGPTFLSTNSSQISLVLNTNSGGGGTNGLASIEYVDLKDVAISNYIASIALTNGNTTFHRLITNNWVKTISAGSNVTIDNQETNLVINASLAGGAASLGDITNTVNAIAILSNAGLGTNNTFVNATLTGGTWTNAENAFYQLTNNMVGSSVGRTPKLLIFDEDYNSDWDDVGGLYVSLRLMGENYVRVLLLSSCVLTTNSSRAMLATAASEGFANIPVVRNTNPSAPTAFEFDWPHNLSTNWLPRYVKSVPAISNSIAGWRTVLANNSTGTVTVTIGGQMRNLYDNFNAVADAISSDDGSNMLRRVERLVIVGSSVTNPAVESIGYEYNLYTDSTAATVLNSLTNFPIDWVTFETGVGIKTGQELVSLNEDHPSYIAYNNLVQSNASTGITWLSGRSSWGAIAQLIAAGMTNDLYVATNGFMTVSATGGTNTWHPDPNGTQRIWLPIPTAAATNNLIKRIAGLQSRPSLNGMGKTSRAFSFKTSDGLERATMGVEEMHTNGYVNLSRRGDVWIRPETSSNRIVLAHYSGAPVMQIDQNAQFGVTTRYKLMDISTFATEWELTYEGGSSIGQNAGVDLSSRMQIPGGRMMFSPGNGGVPALILNPSGYVQLNALYVTNMSIGNTTNGTNIQFGFGSTIGIGLGENESGWRMIGTNGGGIFGTSGAAISRWSSNEMSSLTWNGGIQYHMPLTNATAFQPSSAAATNLIAAHAAGQVPTNAISGNGIGLGISSGTLTVHATNVTHTLATNLTTVELHGNTSTNIYYLSQLHGALSINPTNFTEGRDITLRILNTKATATVTINTNGWNGAIYWRPFPAKGTGNTINSTNNGMLEVNFILTGGSMLPVADILY